MYKRQEYAAWTRAVAPDTDARDRSRLLILGRMGQDKGLARLPSIFSRIPPAMRKRISVSFAGRGNCDEVISTMKALVEVSRVPTEKLLSDFEIAQELAKSDVLLAPYQVVTASSSVVLSLCRGLSIVASVSYTHLRAVSYTHLTLPTTPYV